MKLLAPNGKPSNLNPEQHRLVRTTAFKAWFGDWENSPETSSKVVDENGEPLILWHGSKSKERFKTFNIISKTHRGEEVGSHFGTYEQAYKFIEQRKKNNLNYQLYCVFLNIRNILKVDDILWWTPNNINKYVFLKNNISIYDNPTVNEIIEKLNKNKINGFKYSNLEEGEGFSYSVFDSNNVKILDGSNPDIRFDDGGSIDNKLAFIKKNESGFYWLYIINDKGDYYKEFDGDKRLYVVKDMAKRWGYKLVTPNEFNNYYKIPERLRMHHKYSDGGSILLAPNGKPSNLTTEQYKLVRTPAFKAWFGDWINSPETASKVIDENGEPLVVYHYSPNKFTIFDKTKHPQFVDVVENKKHKPLGYDFSTKEGFYQSKTRNITYAVFLNAKNVFDFSKVNEKEFDKIISILSKIPYYSNHKFQLDLDVKYLKNGDWGLLERPSLEKYFSKNYDGLFMKENDWLNIKVYNSNQIKLADGTNITFDGNNPDIRFKDGGKIKFKIESEEERIEISIKDIGSVTLVETYPKYEFQEDLSEKEFDKLGLDEDDIIGKIEHIAVTDKEKGKGYAKLLMNKAIDVAIKKGLLPLYLNASPMGSKGLGIDDLTRFYESFGFKVFKKQGNNNLMLLNKKYELGGTTMRKPKMSFKRIHK